MSHLSQEQRYEIYAMTQAKFSQTEIAAQIGKNKSVINRELRRNSDQQTGKYMPELAQQKYEQRKREKPKFIRFTETVKDFVIIGLKQDFSPEQIVGRAKFEGKECVSHETIYQFVWEDKKQGGNHYKYLRNRGKRYRKRGAKKDTRGIIKNRRNIKDRPQIVDEKVRLGDLEIDTVIGKNHKGALLTITDRVSLMQWIAKLSGKNAEEAAQKTTEILLPFKDILHTITSDNGKEFAEHERISQDLNIDFFFADPYKSCQRGCNENANGLIRQYFPKGTEFESIDNQKIEYAQNKLNNRPRKKLGFLTPTEFFFLSLKHEKVAFVT